VDNPYDVYVMTSILKWLEQLQPVSQARLDQLNRAGLLHALQEVVITRQGFSAETLQALRYLLVPAGSSSDSSSSSGSSSSNGSAGLPTGGVSQYTSAADDETEQKLALVLVHACQQELSVLGTTLAEDERSLWGASSSRARRSSRKDGNPGSSSSSSTITASEAQTAAAMFRMEKKKVLLACLEALTGKPEEGAATSSTGGAGTAAGAPPPSAAKQAAAAGR
jgi:hypothetical protein